MYDDPDGESPLTPFGPASAHTTMCWAELPILRVASENVNVSCTYDVRPPLPDDKARSPVSAALLNARGRLLREAARVGYNVLLVEGYVTHLRTVV